MALTFVIPGPLRELAGGQDEIRVESSAPSVREALSLLWDRCPALRDRVMTETAEVRPHVNVFVDGESIRYLGGLGAAVPDGAQIVILPAISGG